MATKQITQFNPVITPAVTDELLCQQSGVTRKITSNQIISNIANLSAASALGGTEITIIQQSGTNKKITLTALANYIISQIT
jgi:hypothetical protein